MRPLRTTPHWNYDAASRELADGLDRALAAAPRHDYRVAMRSLAVNGGRTTARGGGWRGGTGWIVSSMATIVRFAEESGNLALMRAEWWRHYVAGAIEDAVISMCWRRSDPVRSREEHRNSLHRVELAIAVAVSPTGMPEYSKAPFRRPDAIGETI